DRFCSLVAREHADLHDLEALRPRPVFASRDQCAPNAFTAFRFRNVKLGDVSERPLLANHVDIVFVAMDDAPAEKQTILSLGNEEVPAFRANLLREYCEILGGDRQIEPAVRLESVLEALRAHDEFVKLRQLLGKTRVTNVDWNVHAFSSA